MTNAQRDELLISLSKGMNNLQELVIDTKKELKEDLNDFKVETNIRLDKIETEQKRLRHEFTEHKKNLRSIKKNSNSLKLRPIKR